MTDILPTLARMVHYYPSKTSMGSGFTPTEKCAAIIVHVENDTTVNLVIFDKVGSPHGRTNVTLVQEGEEAPEDGNYCEWMDYQKGQAAKTEQLEKRLAGQNDNVPTLGSSPSA